MLDRLGYFQSGLVLAAAAGIFGAGLPSLHSEVLGQAEKAPTIEMVSPKGLSLQEIRDRGTRFRAELDQAFKALGDSEKAGHANELTAIAAPYISAGLPVEDAETILKAAGFAEPPSPRARAEQDRTRMDWYAVVAEIPQFAGRVFGPVDVFVMLLPPEQGLAEFAGRRHRMMYYAHP